MELSNNVFFFLSLSLSIGHGCTNKYICIALLTIFVPQCNFVFLWWVSTGQSVWCKVSHIKFYYSAVVSFYRLSVRERAKYASILHCTILV